MIMTFKLKSYLLASALLLPTGLWILHGTLELVTLWVRKLHIVCLPSYYESESMKFHI